MSLPFSSLTGVKRTLAVSVCLCIVLLFVCGSAIAIAERNAAGIGNGTGGGAKLQYTTIPVSMQPLNANYI